MHTIGVAKCCSLIINNNSIFYLKVVLLSSYTVISSFCKKKESSTTINFCCCISRRVSPRFFCIVFPVVHCLISARAALPAVPERTTTTEKTGNEHFWRSKDSWRTPTNIRTCSKITLAIELSPLKRKTGQLVTVII